MSNLKEKYPVFFEQILKKKDGAQIVLKPASGQVKKKEKIIKEPKIKKEKVIKEKLAIGGVKRLISPPCKHCSSLNTITRSTRLRQYYCKDCSRYFTSKVEVST